MRGELFLLKRYITTIKHNTEGSTVRANGGNMTLAKFANQAGKIKQISFRFATETEIRLIVKVDGNEEIKFPTGTQIITNHVMTTPYAPNCFFSHKSAASPYGLTSTYEIEFENDVEILVTNEGTSDSAITDVFVVADIYTPSYIKEKAWFD
jgi:hypothetical protein